MKCILLMLMFSICAKTVANFHKIEIKNNPYPPQTITGFTQIAKSNPIVIINRQVIFIPNLQFLNDYKDTHFWIGNGSKPTSNGTLVPDENGSLNNLDSYYGDNIYLKLPHDIKIDQCDYFGIWSKINQENYGFIQLKSIRNIRDANYGYERVTKSGKIIMRLPKCCPVFSILTDMGCELDEEISAEFKPKFPVFDHNQTHLNNNSLNLKSFHFEPYIYSMDCFSGKYALNPETEDLAILLNGSVILRGYGFFGILSQGKYCLETIENSSFIDIFVCAPENKIETAMFHIYIALITVSTISFGAVFIIFYFILQYKDIFKKCFMAYAFCMCLTFLCLSLVQTINIDNNSDCIILGYIYQFFIMCSFTWLTILCYDILFIITYFEDDTRYGLRINNYLIIAILLPLLSITLSFRNMTPDIPNSFFKPQFEMNDCSLSNETQRLFAFYVPTFSLLIVSLIFLVKAKQKIKVIDSGMKNNYIWISRQLTYKYMYKQCFFTWFIMLISSLVEIMTNKLDNFGGFYNAIIVIEALQGVLIFCIFITHHYTNIKKIRTITAENRNQELEHLSI